MKILIVEDDRPTGELLSKTLADNRYTVDLATDGTVGLELAELWEYDLILLDVKLPGIDGIEVCRQIRGKGNRTPILMLTATQSDRDVITGLDAGADDYVIKPCNLDQLLARIRSLLRRRRDVLPLVLSWGALCLDPGAGRVMYQQQEIFLRPKEYALLEIFLRYPQRIFSRSAILDHLWTIDNFPSENAVTNLMKDLRHQLTAAGVPKDLIETVYGLGYRLKAPPVVLVPAHVAAEEPTRIARSAELPAMGQLEEQFQMSIQQRLALLEETAQLLLASKLSQEKQLVAKNEAHRLAGSLGMYGYHRASEIARSLDRLLAQKISNEQPQEVAQFRRWLAELQQELCQPLQPVQALKALLVLAISEDDQWAETIQQEARRWNLRVEVIPDWSPAQQQFVLETPAAIVLECNRTACSEFESEFESESELNIICAIKQQLPDIPMLILAEQEALANRIAVSRLGNVRYLTKLATSAQIFETLAQLLSQNQPLSQAKVLIVDDDPIVHPILTQLLQPWGLEVISLEEPEQFWQVLTQTHPDLVLLDIEMPTFNGIELCRVVRQDTQYSDLPILVITAHTEADYIRQVFDAGADDLICKPIVDSELVVRVINRIERSRLRQQLELLRRQQSQEWQQQATVDALTQIANRRAFDEFLQRSWRQLQGNESMLSLILCDVDEFKLYNDRYGHPAGDICLQQIARTLQQCIKPGIDQVARYGGEEFAIILPDTSLSGAVNVAERIQQAIAELKIPHSEAAHHPYISLSLGITGTIPAIDKSIDHLIARADRALYAAKEQGRNTYCLYPL